MKFIKHILFGIILSILVYMLLAVLETRNAVLIANNPYTQKEIDFVAYGAKGKVDAQEYQKEYNNRVLTRKTTASHLEEEADAKLKNKMIIKGALPPNSSYRLRVYYQAQKDTPLCKKRTLWSGVVPKGETFEYTPVIKDNRHKIIFPTDELSPNALCQYQIDNIHMDGEMIFKRINNRLKFVGNTYPQSQFPRFVKLIKRWKNQYTLNISENSHLQLIHQQEKRHQKVIRDIRDIDNVTRKQLEKELNLLAKAFDAYNQVHRKKLTKEEGKRLLCNEKNLSTYMRPEALKEYLKTLKKTLFYQNGKPLDPWGQPYQYRSDYAILYSLGADGFKYKKSLSHKLKTIETRKREAIRQMSSMAQLFESYTKAMGYPPDSIQAQKLLRHEKNLASVDFYDQSALDRYHTIPKQNGNPIDPWGHPYQYRVENIDKGINAGIFSLGKDGIKSSDDIYFYDIYFTIRTPSQMKRDYPKANRNDR